VPQDTINISALVAKQIEEARKKAAGQEIFIDEKTPQKDNTANVNIPVISIPVSNVKKVESNRIFEFLSSLSINIKIFIAVSITIIIGVAFRRLTLKLKKKIGTSLKKKIAMIREEKVVIKKDRKLSKVRKALRKIKMIENISENNIELMARELSISKGEVLLAAKLKKFEYGK
jgi:hypothetical protein